ncbi:hypothetical protein PI125_g1219 [Phytophthora idaei]|nr:hypothetical protein PI125_g1219 [Phytophthora idaei]
MWRRSFATMIIVPLPSEYLVRWLGLVDDSWEPCATLLADVPDRVRRTRQSSQRGKVLHGARFQPAPNTLLVNEAALAVCIHDKAQIFAARALSDMRSCVASRDSSVRMNAALVSVFHRVTKAVAAQSRDLAVTAPVAVTGFLRVALQRWNRLAISDAVTVVQRPPSKSFVDGAEQVRV